MRQESAMRTITYNEIISRLSIERRPKETPFPQRKVPPWATVRTTDAFLVKCVQEEYYAATQTSRRLVSMAEPTRAPDWALRLLRRTNAKYIMLYMTLIAKAPECTQKLERGSGKHKVSKNAFEHVFHSVCMTAFAIVVLF